MKVANLTGHITWQSVVIALIIVTAVFLRFWNIQHTARFTRDESSDLARMSHYWQERKITLVGPISNDNTKVFGSLTYYLQMPFAIIWDFEPIGPVVGTAFWGSVTVGLLLLLLHRFHSSSHRSFVFYAGLIAIAIWTPLLITSRWAWNPHLVPLWVGLSLLFYFSKWRWRYGAIGLALGLTLHHHYIAIFSIGIFAGIESMLLIKQRRWGELVQLASGFAFALLPFVLFDLRHPPGLFFGSYLRGNITNIEPVTWSNLVPKLMRNVQVASSEIVSGRFLQTIWVVGALFLVRMDWLASKRNLVLVLPVLAQVIGPVVVDDYSQRYFLPATLFLLTWLLIKRTGWSQLVQLVVLSSMIISSLWQLPRVLTQPIASPSMAVVTDAEHAILQLRANHPELKNANIATLTGSDLDSLAEKYRDLLSIRGVTFRAASEYDASEHLYVISTEAEAAVRSDPNVSMQFFQNSPLLATVSLPEQPWRVYLFVK